MFYFLFYSLNLIIALIRSQGTLYEGEFLWGSPIQALDIAKWTFSNALPSGINPYPSSSCSDHPMFGGYNIFNKDTIIQRDFSSLPNHDYAEIFLKFISIDNWNNQYINIYFDNTLISSYTFPITQPVESIPLYTSPYDSLRHYMAGDGFAVLGADFSSGYFLINSYDLCGNSAYTEYWYYLNLKVAHTSSSLSIKLDVTCISGACSGQWGISDVTYFLESKTEPSLICASNCIFCSGSCKTCYTGYYMVQSFCLLSCPSGFLVDEPNKRCLGCPISQYYDSPNCLPCHNSCYSCNGGLSTNCLSCQTNFLSSGTCVPNCPLGKYPDNSDHKCKSCHSSCSSCSGSLSTNCLSCSGSLYLFITNECLSSCPNGYYEQILPNVCIACALSCLTCVGGLITNCLSCLTGTFLTPLNECLSNCPSGYYPNNINNLCEVCHVSCFQCSGGSSTSCTSCVVSYLTEGNECVPNCPILGFYQRNLDHVCVRCDVSCQTCFDALNIHCLSCFTGKYLFNNECNNDCSIGYYKNTISNTCDICDISCLECTGPTSQECLSCDTTFLSVDNSCVSSCQNGYFGELSSHICKICDISCLTCSGILSTNCLTCSGTFLNQDNQCVSECPIEFYKDLDTFTCKKCHISCKTCSNALETNCLTCNTNYFSQSNVCVTKCLDGYFEDLNTLKCKICDDSCKTCNGPLSTNCLNCNIGVLKNDGTCGTVIDLFCKNGQFLQNKICVEKCSKGYWTNIQNSICENCDTACLACDSLSKYNCTECPINYNLENGKCTISAISPINFINVFSYFEIINRPNDFLLCFNITDITKINEIKKYLKISIIDQNETQYLYNLISTYNNISCIDIKIKFLIESEITNTKVLNLTLLNDTEINGINFKRFEYLAPLNNNTDSKFNINFYWQYTDDPIIITISYTNIYPLLEKFIFNNEFFDITLENYLQNDKYNFEIIKMTQENLNLKLNLVNPIIGDVYVNIKTNIDKVAYLNILNQNYIIQLSEFKIKLFQKYFLSQQTEILINQSITASEVGESTSNSLTFIDFFIKPGSSFAIRGLLAIDLIQLLKYVDINYPPNVAIIFKKGFSKVFVHSKVLNEETLLTFPQILLIYKISYSILNNLIDDLILCFAVIFTGFFLIFINFLIFSKSNKTNILNKSFSFLYRIFVWNMILGILITKYFRISFFVLIAFRFFDPSNIISIINFLVSFFLSIYIFWLLNLFYNIVLFYRKINKSNKIQDISPTKSEFSLNKKYSPILREGEIINNKNYEEKVKKTVDWNKFEFYETPTLKENSINNQNLASPSKTIRNESILTESKNNDITSAHSVVEENIGFNYMNSSSNAKTSIFKNLKVSSPEKNIIYKLNNKKVWDVSPLPNFENTKNNIDKNKKVKHTLIFKILSLGKNLFICPINFFKVFFCFNNKNKEILMYSILFRDLKQTIGSHNFYFCFELLRYFFLPFAAIAFYGAAQAQIILMLSFNLFFFIIVLKNPFKRYFDWVLTMIKEICINLCFITALIIAYCDFKKNMDQELRLNLGWVIVITNIILMVTIILDSGIYIGKKICYSLSIIRNNIRNRNKVTPI